VRPPTKVAIWGRSPEQAEAFAVRVRALGLVAEAAPSVQAAVDGADIICTTTAAPEPILESTWVADGAHINAVGSSRAGPAEIASDLVVRARFFADHREGVLAQGAEFLRAKAAGLVGDDHVLGEIGESWPARCRAAAVPPTSRSTSRSAASSRISPPPATSLPG
jgi:ornithine cyclodeaminase